MNKNISPGELEVGMKITILSCSMGDRSWYGNVLEIKVINLPYIIVDDLGVYGHKGIDLDTRIKTLMELSEEYIDAKLNKCLKK